MPQFEIKQVIECETIEEAETVASGRLGYDEDYGFDYRFIGPSNVVAKAIPLGPVSPEDSEILVRVMNGRSISDLSRSRIQRLRRQGLIVNIGSPRYPEWKLA